jgi:TonB-dependent starch-binding outer membrane protein SusC
MTRRLRWSVAGLLAALALGAAPPASAQGTGVIEGRVTDAQTQRPLEAAQVFVEGTTLGGLTNAQGTYRITGIPVTGASRTVTVRVRALGFNPSTQSVTVSAGQTATANFAVNASAIQLDQVVVTGSGQRSEVKRLGNTVAVITPPQNAPINDVSNLLAAREPGMSALPGGGLSGEGARIRIRGNASLTQSNEPVVFVDGVRINNGGGFGIGTGGGGSPSRLDDIDPNTIERIEVLKGAAAATLYGTEASNGVIQIFTKNGSSGAPRWSFTLQGDASDFVDRVAPNSGYASRQSQADSLAAFWKIPGLKPYQVFEVPIFKDFFTETGLGQTAAGSVQGGSQGFTYFASGRYYNEDGPFGGEEFGPAQDKVRRIQTTANLQLVPFSNLRLGIRNNYYNIDITTPENNNNIYGVNSLAYMARPELASCRSRGTGAVSEYLGPGRCSGPGDRFGNQAFMTAREAMGQINNSVVSRYLGVVDGDYKVMEGMNWTTALGFDYTAQRDFGFSRFGYNVDLFTSQVPAGSRATFNGDRRVVTLDSKLSYNRDFGSDITTATTLGLQVFNDRTNNRSGFSQDFPGPGIEVVGAGGAGITTGETFLTTINGGYFGQSQIGYKNWIFMNVGGRYDFSSAFGEAAPGVFYPKISFSFVPSDLTGWGAPLGLSTFRLRAAWGQSGRQPGAFDRFTTFNPFSSSLGAGLQPGQLGNDNLEPEIATEIEGGFEAGFFDNRLGLEFTYWDRVVEDGLVTRQFATSGGFRNAQLTNIGQIDASGYEVNVRGQVLRTNRNTLELFANAAYLKQTLTSLGGAPPLKVGYFRYRGFLKEGDPLGSLYAPRLAVACNGAPKQNKAGQNILCLSADQVPIRTSATGAPITRAQLVQYFSQPRDIQTGAVQAALQPVLADYDGNGNVFEQLVGDVIPDWTGAFGGNFNWGSSWKFQTLFEWRTGFKVQNLTDGFRGSQHPSIGSNRKEFDELAATMENPASTPEQRADAAIKYVTKHRRLLEPGLHQAEDGDFIRLREIALTYNIPAGLASRLKSRNASITLSGRNLWLATKYSGLDPESNENGRGSTGALTDNFLVSTDGFGLPLQRRVSLILNFGF